MVEITVTETVAAETVLPTDGSQEIVYPKYLTFETPLTSDWGEENTSKYTIGTGHYSGVYNVYNHCSHVDNDWTIWYGMYVDGYVKATYPEIDRSKISDSVSIWSEMKPQIVGDLKRGLTRKNQEDSFDVEFTNIQNETVNGFSVAKMTGSVSITGGEPLSMDIAGYSFLDDDLVFYFIVADSYDAFYEHRVPNIDKDVIAREVIGTLRLR